MHYPNTCLLGHRDNFFEKVQFHTVARRVRRKIEHQHLGLRVAVANGLLELLKESIFVGHGHVS